MQAMRWDDLQYLLAVATTGQHGRAGRQLGVDATTVARRIRRLEQDVGARLFEQGRDGQTLTAAGRTLRDTAEAMARVAAGVAVPAEDGALTGVLRVSVSEGFGTGFVAPRLADFAARHPGIALELASSSGFLSPTRRETDVAILLGRPREGPLITRKLADYALGLYASADYISRIGSPLDIATLGRHPLIGYVPDLLYSPELNYLDEVVPGLAPRLRSSSILAQAALTAAGGGIAVLPCFLAARDVTLVRVLPGTAIRRSFWLVTHRDVRDAPRVRAFVEWIVAAAAAGRGLLMGE